MCSGNHCKNGKLIVSENTEAVSAASPNESIDTCQPETASASYVDDPQQTEQSEKAEPVDRKTADVAVSAVSQIRNSETTASAAVFYCHPGTDCYESFSDVVKNANKTS